MKGCYRNTMNINNQNSKAKDTEICNIDTVRGCENACESCFAKRNTAITIKHFEIPVPIAQYSGKMHPDRYYRFGNFGDSASNWTHSEQLLAKYGFEKFFCITKLQKIDGYTGKFNKLQVSVDPLNAEHFKITLDNLKILLKKFKDTQIVLRIRSVKTSNKQIQKRQQQAVDFANKNQLRVLETRVRFVKKDDSIEKYQLDHTAYAYRKSYLRPAKGQSFLNGVAQHYICDVKEKKCNGCKLCLKLFWEEH